MPVYTQSQLKSDVNSKIKGKIAVLVDFQSTLNQGVRQALSEIDFRSMRRRTPLTPNLFSGIFEYAAPTDLKGYGIITVENQKFSRRPNWSLVPYEEFMRRQDNLAIAINDYDFTRKVLIKATVDDDKKTISTLDALGAGGGTWALFGDAENVIADLDNYVEGNGSIKFDISSAAGTTAGIQNTALNTTDITDYLQGNGSLLVWAYITSTTNLTNYILRVGNDSLNYYSKTVTTQADGTAFVAGWNLLRFALTSLTETGSVTDTTIDYCALYMTKTSAKVSELGYRFDGLVLRRGEINNLYYYSKYGWQSSGGSYKENSTTTSDYLNCDTEEYEIILAKCAEIAADDVDEEKVSEKQAANFRKLKKVYELTNPSEALIMISTTSDFVKL